MTIEKRQLSEQNDNFIMLPTVDFCFKELMQNKEVRKGILSALLGKKSGRIRRYRVTSNNSSTRISG